MCFEPTARPPLPPIAGGAGLADRADLVLEAEDGNRFSAFSAHAPDPAAPAAVILPDVRGLHPFYRDLTERFAEAGVSAVAVDYFGRTAGLGVRDDDFDYMDHVKRTHPDTVAADVRAAVSYLTSDGTVNAPDPALYGVGFCFGGRHSFNLAGRGQGLSGVIGFYGAPQRRGPDDTQAPIDQVAGYRCPVLGLFGGADQGIPREAIDAFDVALSGADVPHELVVYDGAPHSFFDRTFDEHAEAGQDAWRRILGFMGVGE
jgi:carboxymethylenebutenolidase